MYRAAEGKKILLAPFFISSSISCSELTVHSVRSTTMAWPSYVCDKGKKYYYKKEKTACFGPQASCPTTALNCQQLIYACSHLHPALEHSSQSVYSLGGKRWNESERHSRWPVITGFLTNESTWPTENVHSPTVKKPVRLHVFIALVQLNPCLKSTPPGFCLHTYLCLYFCSTSLHIHTCRQWLPNHTTWHTSNIQTALKSQHLKLEYPRGLPHDAHTHLQHLLLPPLSSTLKKTYACAQYSYFCRSLVFINFINIGANTFSNGHHL